MSLNVLNTLKLVRPFIKAKGLPFEQFGLISDGKLCITNGVAQVEIDIDLPFNACVNLHQLLTLLTNVKSESVIVVKDNEIILTADDVAYKIDTFPAEQFEGYVGKYSAEFVECNNPQILKKATNIAIDYLANISNEDNINDVVELMHIYNGFVFFTDRKTIYQFILDFNMPNMSFDLGAVTSLNTLFKTAGDIVGFNFVNNVLGIKCQNFTVYVPTRESVTSATLLDKLNGILDKHFKMKSTKVCLNEQVIEQFKLIMKLSRNKILFFNNTFCQSGNEQIQYQSLCEKPFSFKLSFTNLDNILKLSNEISITDENQLFVQTANARMLLSGIGED